MKQNQSKNKAQKYPNRRHRENTAYVTFKAKQKNAKNKENIKKITKKYASENSVPELAA